MAPSVELIDYTLRYTPRELGALYVHIILDDLEDPFSVDLSDDVDFTSELDDLRRWHSEYNRGGDDRKLRQVLRKGHVEYNKLKKYVC